MPELAMPVTLNTDLLRTDLDDGVLTVWIDTPDARVNTIDETMIAAFEAVIDAAETTSEVEALVFISGKDDTFIAGADLDMLKAFEQPADVRALSRRAHALLDRLQALDAPSVAAVHGAAMGGGLEMTLGCTYRIATTSSKTQMAFPEVKLGLLPGGGGTQYLPRLVGLQQSLPLLLTGKTTYPKKAKRIGLVDALTHAPGLHQAAQKAARQLADGTLTPDRPSDWTDRLLESNPLTRRGVYWKAGQDTKKETRGNYPAPPRIIECVKTGLEHGLEAGLDAEATAFGELVFTPESKALVSLFFAKRQADTNDHADDARPVQRMAVLGAGLMGAGIADVSARDGLDVFVKDIDLKHASAARKHIYKTASKRTKKGIISSFERDTLMERIQPVGSYDALATADLIIEAVPESINLKQSVLADVEAVVSDECVIASNTSSIPIADIAANAERPERVLGMHYFSPVEKMPLLEIIATESTSKEAVATAYEVGLRQGKSVIVVNDGPGFYTTRILALYMNEALLLLDEGADALQVETAMKDFGFPMGPYELFDLVGIDVAAKITEVMGRYLEGDRYRISEAASPVAEAGLHGQKTKRGFYTYEGSGSDPKRGDFNPGIYRFFGGSDRADIDPKAVQQRLALTMVNEALRCLDEDILRDPVDGDIGAVFGLGFPPFRGGPFRYVDAEGAGRIQQLLHRHMQEHGDRFTPAESLVRHAQNGTTYHGDSA